MLSCATTTLDGVATNYAILNHCDANGKLMAQDSSHIVLLGSAMSVAYDGAAAIVTLDSLDVKLVSFDDQFEIRWEIRYQVPKLKNTNFVGYADFLVSPSALIRTGDGGYVAAVAVRTAPIWNSSLERESFMIRVDSTGRQMWQASLIASIAEYIVDIVEAVNGDIVAAVFTQPLKSLESMSCGMIRFDRKGRIVWSRDLKQHAGQYVRDIELTDDGGFLLLTQFTDSISPVSYDMELIQTDEDGLVIKRMLIGVPNENENGTNLLSNSHGNWTIVGTTRSLAEWHTNVWVCSVTGTGGTNWSRSYDLQGNESDPDAIIAKSGTIIVGGMAGGSEFHDGWILVLSSQGDSLWSKKYDSGVAKLGLGNNDEVLYIGTGRAIQLR